MREYTIQVLKTSINKSLYYIITVVGILQIMCADIALSEKYWMLTIESAVNCWIWTSSLHPGMFLGDMNKGRYFYGAPSGIHSTLLCSCSTMVMIWVQM